MSLKKLAAPSNISITILQFVMLICLRGLVNKLCINLFEAKWKIIEKMQNIKMKTPSLVPAFYLLYACNTYVALTRLTLPFYCIMNQDSAMQHYQLSIFAQAPSVTYSVQHLFCCLFPST